MSEFADRQYPRVRIKATVDVNAEELILFHPVENISLGGVCIQVPSLQEAGSKVEIVINLTEDEDEIEAKAEVVWTAESPEPRLGLRFIEMDDNARLRLRSYLYKTNTPEDE